MALTGFGGFRQPRERRVGQVEGQGQGPGGDIVERVVTKLRALLHHRFGERELLLPGGNHPGMTRAEALVGDIQVFIEAAIRHLVQVKHVEQRPRPGGVLVVADDPA